MAGRCNDENFPLPLKFKQLLLATEASDHQLIVSRQKQRIFMTSAILMAARSPYQRLVRPRKLRE